MDDLFWIEQILNVLHSGCDLTYIDSDNERRYILGVENIVTDDSFVGLSVLDNLEFNDYEFFVSFKKGITRIEFNKVNLLTQRLFEDICIRLEKRQRRSSKQKQQIYLYHRHAKPRNFLTQDKVPLWVAILIGLLPTLVAIYALIK